MHCYPYKTHILSPFLSRCNTSFEPPIPASATVDSAVNLSSISLRYFRFRRVRRDLRLKKPNPQSWQNPQIVMSDLVGKLNDDGFNLGAIPPVEPFESVWTKATRLGNGHSSRLERRAQDYIANNHRSTVRLEYDVSGSESSDFAEVTEARTVRFMKKGVVASSKTLIRERIGRQRHSVFNSSQNFRSDSSFGHVGRPPVDSNSEYNAYRDPNTQLLTVKKVSHPPPEHSRNNETALYDNLALGGPSGDKSTVSDEIAPWMNTGDKHHINRRSNFLITREKEVDHQSASRVYEGSFLKRVNSPLPLQDPFSGNNHSLEDGGLQYHKIHGFASNETFPSQNHHADPFTPEKLHANSHSSRKMPDSVRGKETMINFVDGSAKGTSSFPQRTNNFLSLEEAESNSSKKNRAFWESANPGYVERNTPTKSLTFPSSGMGERGVEFQPPGNKSPEIITKNESSADTDTMDIGDLKEQTEFSGINSSPLNKMYPNPPSQVETTSVGEATNKLPDINEEIPIHQAASSLVNDTTLSTSRTLSLDAENLISPHQETKRKSSNSLSTPEASDPITRWFKRLRSSPPGNVEATTKLGSSGGSGGGGALENQETLLSETWIKRWCCNKAATQEVAPCEPEMNGKEESEKQEFPSIAAMALMGRAMNGFRPCEFQVSGSFVVWNSNDSILN